VNNFVITNKTNGRKHQRETNIVTRTSTKENEVCSHREEVG